MGRKAPRQGRHTALSSPVVRIPSAPLKIMSHFLFFGVVQEGLKTPIKIEVQKASKSAIAAVEAAGGTIKCGYYNKTGIQALLRVSVHS